MARVKIFKNEKLLSSGHITHVRDQNVVEPGQEVDKRGNTDRVGSAEGFGGKGCQIINTHEMDLTITETGG